MNCHRNWQKRLKRELVGKWKMRDQEIIYHPIQCSSRQKPGLLSDQANFRGPASGKRLFDFLVSLQRKSNAIIPYILFIIYGALNRTRSERSDLVVVTSVSDLF